MTRLETKCRRYENYTYLRYRNAEKCMIWFDDTVNYLVALKSCQEKGALLGTFKTLSEISLLRQFAKESLWVGLDKIDKPAFTWVDDGKPVHNFSFYFPDYPASNMKNLFDCTEYMLMVYRFKFNDQNCFLDAPYICEIRLNLN
ncbi:C-type lectin domain family 6 member A [Biomphalaria pfeifferi]|uniref:C-type lectin domain family 6 member A n=1 Tax=Biomphalaria pfeifferi TaxID=112525 RepID=A0AAD8C6U2_BIOPF|nr:C-type lectin domain family 6 member A [Biomphalaria pfeifferi]